MKAAPSGCCLAVLVALAALALGACAPIAPYGGPDPAPGSARTHRIASIMPSDSTGRWRLASGDGGGAAIGNRPVTVLLYGDNRNGFRMEYHTAEYRALSQMFSRGLGGFAKGLLYTPLFLLKSIVPTLDGPRDLVTSFTRYTRAGSEQRVLDAMQPFLPADLVISTGDVVTDGRRGRLWEDYVSRHRALREGSLLLAAPGNHERLYDSLASHAWDAAMGEAPEPGCRWYSADLPAVGARFVFLDSHMITDPHGRYKDSLSRARVEAQLEFAEQRLAAPSRYKFVVLHHPPVTTGHYENDWAPDDAGDPVTRHRARLLELCARHRVTAVLAGHEHLYYRCFLADSAGAGFWEVITGGAGAPLYPIESRALQGALSTPLPRGLRVVGESAFGRTAFHFCRIVFPPMADGEHAPLVMEVFRVLSRGRVERVDRVNLATSPARREPGS